MVPEEMNNLLCPGDAEVSIFTTTMVFGFDIAPDSGGIWAPGHL
jgi:hypothetical protein